MFYRFSFTKMFSRCRVQNCRHSSTVIYEKSPKIFYTFPIITSLLGIWQVKRYFWKQELKENMQIEADIIHTEFPCLSECRENMNKKFKIVGKFLHDKEYLVGPCNPTECHHPAPKYPGTNSNSLRAFHIITPFVIKDSGKSILVDRGYLSSQSERLNKNLRLETVISEGDDVVVGYLTRLLSATDVSRKQIWKTVDYEIFCIKADSSMSFPEGPFGQDIKLKVYDNHLEYAASWFSITAIFVAMLMSKRVQNPMKMSKS